MRSHQDEGERLAQWVQAHGVAILGFLTRQIKDRHVADDLLQEVFCRAWQARERYSDLGQERAFLLRIATRLVQDEWRRGKSRFGKRHVELELHQPADEKCEAPAEQLSRVELSQQLNKALEALSAAQQQTLLLRFYGDLSFDEIASIMACPLNTVLSHCRRGLSALRELLAEKL